ncbi:MAG TPA: type II toxin-antitoxin system Phd/YefM family antitoxin [Spirochaetia bacterium]|nr:type II toxin-antitoxin system Phd/YefM family antitoxin [Spirochaetia bacterium]
MQAERTVAIAELKAHLSAELRRVQEGETTIIVDHRKPVAILSGLDPTPKYAYRRSGPFVWREFEPLTTAAIQALIEKERADSW